MRHRFVRATASTAVLLVFVRAACAAETLDTVTITASPIGEGESLATLVESVDRDAVLRRGAASLGDALADIPGVSASGFAPGASHPLIRGFDASRVRVLENGIGSFDVADVGPDHGTPIDPLSASRIEIVRGAGTLRYGSQAIGGVVNTLNDRVPWRRPAGGWQGEISLAGASAADSREGAGRFDGAMGPLVVHGDAFRRRAADYGTPDGPQENSFFDGHGGAVGAGYVGAGGRAGMALVNFGADYGIPNEPAFIRVNQNKWLTRAARDFTGGVLQGLTLDAGYSDYEHRELDAVDRSVAATFLDEEWEARGEAVFGAWGPFSSAAFGVQAQRRHYSALGEAADYLRPTLARSGAVFAFAEAPWGERVKLQLGLRMEDASLSGRRGTPEALTRSYAPFSASVSTVFSATPVLQLGLTLASTARAPAQTELFAEGPHDGPGTFERGNAGLREERSNALEATLHWRGGDTHLEAAVWAARFDRFVHGAFTGRSCDDQGRCVAGDAFDLRELVYSQRAAMFRGAELQIDRALGTLAGGELSARIDGDLVRAGFTGGGGNVPRIPPWKLSAGLAWESSRADAAVTLRHAGRQEHPGALDTPTPGWTALEAQLGWRPRGDDRTELALVGRNLTDTRQRNAASFNKDTVLMPGRDLRLVLRARW